MTSSPHNAPEARGSTEPFESYSWLHHAQTQADALFNNWCLSWREGTELEDAIAVLERALHHAETFPNTETAVSAEILRRQARYWQESFFRQRRRIDAEEAARCLRKVLQYEPSDFLAMANLSWIYLTQTSVTGCRMMLDDAIALSENAIVQSRADHEAFSWTLKVAAMCLLERAQLDGCYEDLEIAAQLLLVGLALPNLANDDPAILRLLLAEIHLLQFESLENLEHIDRAASLLGQVPSTYSVRAAHEPFLNLIYGKLYKAKWDCFRSWKDVIASFRAYMTGFKAVSKNSACPSSAAIDAAFGGADVARLGWKYGNNEQLLSKSYLFANMLCTAARKIALEWHLSGISGVEAQAQFIMGEILQDRYARYHASQLLDNAISAFRQSARMTDVKDAVFMHRALRLSSVLRMRSAAGRTKHYQRQTDMYEARHWAGKSIRSHIPLSRWQHVGCTLELGHLIWQSGAPDTRVIPLYQHAVELGTPVDRVIPLYQHAVELDTMHFTFRADAWRSLAKALIARGRNMKCIEDLHTARAYLDKVETLEKERNDQSTGRLPVAASLQSEYYQLTGEVAYRVQAAYIQYEILRKHRYTLMERLGAAVRFAHFSFWLADNRNSDMEKMLQTMNIKIFDSVHYSKATQTCVDLMTQLVSECYDQAQQFYIIRVLSLLPSINVRAAISAGENAVTIVNALEKGRSIFWDRLTNGKGQLVELAEKHEELASQYRDLRIRLDQTAQPDNMFVKEPQDKFLLESEMNSLVAKIRKQDGFKDFLLPPLDPSKLQTYGANGPVVMLVVHEPTGYALITAADSIFIMPLEEYTWEACEAHNGLLRQALDLVCSRQDQARATDLLYQVLSWLWEATAKPVLDRLGFVGSPDPADGLPRLWWITCGWANRFPIHAAGDHLRRLRTNEPCTVMDRVISSYSPTLKGLMYSRIRMQELVKLSNTTTEPPIALLAAMEETIDRPKLGDAVREVKCVQPILEPQFHVCSFTDPPPTRKDVVTNLRKCTIAHLACHGEADPSDPLRSKILLHDWGPKPLRVGFIMRMDMENCQLVYLSACETAVNKDEKLAEEGLHISGAFQMAGVPNTVATWWEINDQEAVAVAEGFYGRLKDEKGKVDVGRAAGALRGALMEMRDAGVSPLVWGSYVHFGA